MHYISKCFKKLSWLSGKILANEVILLSKENIFIWLQIIDSNILLVKLIG